MKHRLGAIVALAAALGSAGHAVGADVKRYPERPIRFIAPYAPGGTADFVARVVAEGLTHELGQTVVVDNRPGAASTLGMQLTAQATPDGYTIAINNIGLAINETLRPSRQYDALKDLAPVGLLGTTPSVLVVGNKLAVKTVADLLRMAKAQPGKVAYGSAGAGSATHLAVALLENVAGVRLLHVPYKGGGPALKAMMSGEVQCALVPIPTAYPQIKAGLVHPLAVSGAKPSPALPGLPTIAQTVPGYDFVSWYGLLAPARVPSPVVAQLNRATGTALRTPDIAGRLQKAGLDPEPSTPAEFDKLIRAEIAKWRKVIDAAGIARQS